MYRQNLKAFLERERAKEAAMVKQAIQKDHIETTTYTKRKKIGPYWLLCNTVDHPEVWAPSTGKKSYIIEIDGENFEFHHEMTGKEFEHLHTEMDIKAEMNMTPPANNPDSLSSDMENRDMPQSVNTQNSDQVVSQIPDGVTGSVHTAAMDKVEVLKQIQSILEHSQVQPNRIQRTLRTLRSILDRSMKPVALIDRVKSALNYEEIETWVIDKVVGEIRAGLDGEHTPVAKDLTYLIEDANALKAKIEAVKPSYSEDIEISKALDDATSACDLVTHHLLDIMEDNQPKKERLMAKLNFHANPINVNVADEIQDGDVLSFGDRAFIKVIKILVDLKENLVKVQWTEKHAEGVNRYEETLPTFRQRLQTLKRIYNSSMMVAKKESFTYDCAECGKKFKSFDKLTKKSERVCPECGE